MFSSFLLRPPTYGASVNIAFVSTIFLLKIFNNCLYVSKKANNISFNSLCAHMCAKTITFEWKFRFNCGLNFTDNFFQSWTVNLIIINNFLRRHQCLKCLWSSFHAQRVKRQYSFRVGVEFTVSYISATLKH